MQHCLCLDVSLLLRSLQKVIRYVSISGVQLGSSDAWVLAVPFLVSLRVNSSWFLGGQRENTGESTQSEGSGAQKLSVSS